MPLVGVVVYVRLTGDADIATAKCIRKQLAGIVGPSVIDLTDVRHIDSAGLRELLLVATRTGAGATTLINGAAHLHRLFYLVGFDRLFVLIDGVADTRPRLPLNFRGLPIHHDAR